MDEQEAPSSVPAVAEQDTPQVANSTTEDAPPASATEIPVAAPPSQIPDTDAQKPQDDSMQIDPQPQAQPVEQVPDHTPEELPIATPAEPNQTSMPTPQPASTTTPSRGGSASARGSRSSKRVSFPLNGEDTPITVTDATPSSAPRGRPPGRPRGSRARGPARGTTRGSRGGRGGKRKRADNDEDDGGSSDSETYAPTTTKSGRNVQKPTSFVPPAQPSPPPMPSYKKKRTYRRNPESAVCKMCLRGVSPASNMIVFCDGCNVPYHRHCHQPPIDQSVIEEVDKEWYCKQCERERIQPAPAAHVAGFVAAENASEEEVRGRLESNCDLTANVQQQRQKYFSSLPPGLLVTLLTKATTLHPDLPVFDPSFQPTGTAGGATQQPLPDGQAHPPVQPLPKVTAPILRNAEDSDDDRYGSDEHPSHYPRPGQGLMSTLPPEKEDLHYLVDDENSRGVFTHIYQPDPKTEVAETSVGAEAQ